MMILLLVFLAAVLCMAFGHVCKVGRWGLFISVYEDPPRGRLLNALSVGHTLNALLPLRIGDIARVVLAGRRLRNGYSLSLATVLADLYIDFVTVFAMISLLAVWGKGGERLHRVAGIYSLIFLIAVLLTIIAIVFRKWIKHAIRTVASIFNQAIEFRILYVSYLVFASLKAMVRDMDRRKLVVWTFGIWASYVASYVLFAEALQRCGLPYTASDVFASLFSGMGIYSKPVHEIPIWVAYLILPLFVCVLLAIWVGRHNRGAETYRSTLPQMNREDRLAFLRSYYEEEDRDRIQAYLDINRDVTIVEDISSGSNASTLLVMGEDGTLFYRKYAFNEDAEKLQEQIDWMEAHQGDIPLPEVRNKNRGINYVAYDMPSHSGTVSLFRLIHTVSEDQAWQCISEALRDIDCGLHQRNRRHADSDSVALYLNEKLDRNIRAIRQSRHIKPLEAYREVVVNGVRLPTLGSYGGLLDHGFLKGLFQDDPCADIHGDLTVENIVCLSDGSKYPWGTGRASGYYFIDPNGGNIHESPFLDYGKLLQSLHGNYEFLMMVSEVQVHGNKISFMMAKSEKYAGIYERYKNYLQEKFSQREILSIYCHEVIHWLRLIPYKIQKNERLAVVFYAGLLAVLKDVEEMAYGKEDKIGNL